MIKLGFIGFGEAAYNISIGLKSEGVTGIVAYDAMADKPPMSELIKTRAKEADVALLPQAEDVAKEAEIVIVSVPSSFTIDACRSVIGVMRPGQIYADVGASTPETKRQVWKLLKNKGVLFSDSAMLGSLPLSKHKVPIVASGNGAEAFYEALAPYGMKIEVVGENPGDASAIKLLRSVYMKGIAALMIEMLEGAEANGVSDQVIHSVGESLDGIKFEDHLNRLVTGTAIHAHRRAVELDGSIKMLEESGICYDMTLSAKNRHAMLEPYDFAEKFVQHKPNGWKEILDIINSKSECTA
ncbi:MAG: Phosphogluconate dehydrogenase, NAD-binding, putative-like protein [Bacillota bacterium]|jgi:3-hydroxyisobutyrate dehydrogenase-like beta-hydroxyacid dehydrogenase|nr:Phosphogluconate dehydrogenase, NAD-binding, putative-like protein [Bacillota bacterium]